MKKAIAIIAVIAILGILKVVADKPNNTPSTKTNAPTATTTTPNSSTPTSQAKTSNASYKDGTYTGQAEDTPYGNVQIAVVVSGGKITDVKFLQMPNDQENSRVVTGFAEPQLKQNAISAQSANIDFVTGATDTSIGFRSSLQSALDQASASAIANENV